MANEVSVDITIEEKAALRALTNLTKGIDSTTKETVKGVKKIDMAFASFAGNLAANAVGATIRKIGDGVGTLVRVGTDLVNASIVQEDAINELNQALVRNGQFTEKTSKELQNFASEMQGVTTIGDEAIIGQIAFAQSMGATAEQSKVIVAAAADMSEALGMDFNSAVRNVSKTLGGYAGELGETIPQLKNLTKEQLMAGDGVKLLAKEFEGAAQAATQTFSGAMKQTSGIFGDLQESLGSFVTQSPVAIAAIKGLGGAFTGVKGTIDENSASIQSFVDGAIVGGLVKGVEVGVQSIIFFNNAIDGTKNFINFLTDAAFAGVQSIYGFGAGVLDASIKIKEFLGLNTEKLESMRAGFQEEIEMQQIARELAQQDTAERLMRQEEFTEQMTGLQNKMNESILSEVEAVKKKDEGILESNIKASKKIQKEKIKSNEKELTFTEKFNKARLALDEELNSKSMKSRQRALGDASQLMQSSNKELFALGKAAALANHAVNAASAVSNALGAFPPPVNFVMAGIVGAAMVVTGAKIASAKPPAYANSGVIGGMTGASTGMDNSMATVRNGEMILNAADQREVLTGLKGGAFSSGDNSELMEVMASQPIIVEIDGIEVARAVRNARESGLAV